MMSRYERMQMILDFIARQNGSVTLGEVAKGVGLKRSNYLNLIVVDLVEKGKVRCEWADHPKFGRTRYFWVDVTATTEDLYEYGAPEAFWAEMNGRDTK